MRKDEYTLRGLANKIGTNYSYLSRVLSGRDVVTMKRKGVQITTVAINGGKVYRLKELEAVNDEVKCCSCDTPVLKNDGTIDYCENCGDDLE